MLSEDEPSQTSASEGSSAAADPVSDATSLVRSPQWFRRLLERLGLFPAPPEGLAFHAFVSYSHAADAPLARALQRVLQRFAKPWNRARALHVFRDEASLAVNPNLWQEIERALDASDYYILLASPDAAGSYWVRKEAERWVQTKPSDHLLLALTEGEIVWDRTKGDFDWERTTALPPTLRGVFEQEPFWIDLRWTREETELSLTAPRFTDAVVSLAAPIHGRPKDELFGEEVLQQRRAVRVRRVAAATLTALTVAAIVGGVVALRERSSAIAEATNAQSVALAADANSATGVNPYASLVLSLAALAPYRAGPSSPASALVTMARAQQNVQSQGLIGVLQGRHSSVTSVAFSPDDRTVAAGTDDGTVLVWDTANHTRLAALTAGTGNPVYSVAFSPDGRTLAAGTVRGRVLVWDTANHTRLASLSTRNNTALYSVAFSPDGRTLAAGTDDGTVLVWDTASHTQLAALSAGTGNTVYSVAFSPDGRTLAAGTARRHGAAMGHR